MRHFHCDACRRTMPENLVAFSTAGKALLCVSGLALGAKTKNAWAAVGLALLGTMIGHLIDEEVSPQCPECGVVLKLVLDSVL